MGLNINFLTHSIMLCDICGKNPATVHLTEIIDGNITEIHLCESCAKKKSGDFQKTFSVSDFLSGLAGIDSLSPAVSSKAVCSNCGLTYKEFTEKGKFGCFQCYSDFKDKILPLLRKIHGSITYKGKLPKMKKKFDIPVSDKLDLLRKQLERAIKIEEYEEAARIRDQIKEAEKKSLNKQKKGKNKLRKD